MGHEQRPLMGCRPGWCGGRCGGRSKTVRVERGATVRDSKEHPELMVLITAGLREALLAAVRYGMHNLLR